MFFFNGAHCHMTARENAKYIVVNHKLPWGHKKLPMPEDDEPEYMLSDEFELYDTLKNIAMLTMAMSFGLFVLGCIGKKMVTWRKAKCAKFMVRKAFGCFAFFFFVYGMTKQQGKVFMTLFMRNCDEETKEHMEEKMKHKIGMCPVMIFFIILQAVHIYKLHSFKHSLEKVKLVEETKKEQDEKNRIILPFMFQSESICQNEK